jgi:hypothetical protein
MMQALSAHGIQRQHTCMRVFARVFKVRICDCVYKIHLRHLAVVLHALFSGNLIVIIWCAFFPAGNRLGFIHLLANDDVHL